MKDDVLCEDHESLCRPPRPQPPDLDVCHVGSLMLPCDTDAFAQHILNV